MSEPIIEYYYVCVRVCECGVYEYGVCGVHECVCGVRGWCSYS